MAYCGPTNVDCTLPTAEWQVFSIPSLLRNDKSVFCNLSTAEWKVFPVPCSLRNVKCFLYLVYCGIRSFVCFLPTVEWQVFPLPCLLRNGKCFLYLVHCGKTNVFFTLPTAQWCFLYLVYCGMTSVLYIMSDAEWHVLSTPYWNVVRTVASQTKVNILIPQIRMTNAVCIHTIATGARKLSRNKGLANKVMWNDSCSVCLHAVDIDMTCHFVMIHTA